MTDFQSNFKPPRKTQAERDAEKRANANAAKSVKHGRVRVRDNASNAPGLAFPKGRTIDEDTAADHAEEVKQIRKTREKVWRRTSHCECCGDSEQETAQKHPKAEHEMNEDPPRSKTRGLPPAQRFNVRVCCRICRPCHKLVTDNVIRFSFHDEERRFLSDYDVLDVASGHILRHMRRGPGQDYAVWTKGAQ